MELEEIFPAVEAAKKAVHLRPDWPQGRQTLGRSLLNVGQLYPASIFKFLNSLISSQAICFAGPLNTSLGVAITWLLTFCFQNQWLGNHQV